jgi:hypothetical protein
MISYHNLKISFNSIIYLIFSKTYFNLSLTIFPLGLRIYIEIFSISLNMFKLLINWLFNSFKVVSFVDNSGTYNFKNSNLRLTTCKNLHRSFIFFCKITLEIIICIFYHVKIKYNHTKIETIAKIVKSLKIAKYWFIKLNRNTVNNLIRIHIWSDLIYRISIKSCNIN